MASASNNHILIPLYAKKLADVTDIPVGTVNRVDINIYFREIMGVSAGANATGTGRTAAMDDYFKKLKFLLTLPDGTKTLTTKEFLLWLEARPRICDAWRKFITVLHQEAIGILQKQENDARAIREKFKVHDPRQVDQHLLWENPDAASRFSMVGAMLDEINKMEECFRQRKEELLGQKTGLFAGLDADKLFANPYSRANAGPSSSTTGGTTTQAATSTETPEDITMDG